VISITDGQIYLQENLFRSGVRPAVDVGISVSRVGGAAQVKAMRSVAGTLKVDLAQFRDLEAFATFASDLDAVSKAQLERGERLVELLKQGLHAPMPVEEQVISIFAGTSGYLDAIPASDVGRFETELLDYMRTRKADLMATIRDQGTLPEGDALQHALEEFVRGFRPTATGGGEANVTATDATPVGPETSPETLETE
jgi:F-type H+-transporting ATPase subunit alpha